MINLAYLAAAVLFILGLMGLSHPRTARRGNLTGATGMLLAVVVTLFDHNVIEAGAQGLLFIFGAVLIGGTIGAVFALRIKMTAMPQMVALLNGFGGAASVLVAGGAFLDVTHAGIHPPLQLTVATAASGLIGAVTFWGSLVAFDKLQELLLPGKPIHYPLQQPLNILLFVAAIGFGATIVLNPGAEWAFLGLVIVASVLGITLTLPIGGADMPVAIALLNSYSGIAAAATGFVLSNNALIITGSLVGASGIILTRIMCRAMNRSLMNVLLGKVGGGDSQGASADEVYAGKVKSASAEEVAMVLDTARTVIIVPGYGMAVSQAQHAVRELANLLESRGARVEFGIHPVAGRMPGHMNVLLAEADVPYDRLKEQSVINSQFDQTDAVLVIGANDVVNPLARTDPTSPIAGMPILDVDKARTVVVMKRSLSPGFAGIPNPLFAADNTLMYFGDGKTAVQALITAIKES
jgi:H+-translocating NAD(P) transhydrogenase subunit beta